jgi:hypothetical protein
MNPGRLIKPQNIISGNGTDENLRYKFCPPILPFIQ